MQRPLVLLAMLAMAQTVAGHGYLWQPKSRNIILNSEGNEDCPHCLPAGGPGKVGELAGGVFPQTRDAAFEAKRHGACGDAADATNPKYNPYTNHHDAFTVMKTGSSVTFKVVVTTHHYGHFEFALCDTKDLRNEDKVTEECLIKHVLQRDPANPGTGDYYSPIDPNYPERYYMIPKCQGASTGPVVGQLHEMNYLLPAGLECKHCVLQWWWVTANSCIPPGYKNFNFPANPSAECKWWHEGIVDCGQGGYPEEFWNCADVQITIDGKGTGPPIPPQLEAWEDEMLKGVNALRSGVNAAPKNRELVWSAPDASDAKALISGGACPATDKAKGLISGSGSPAEVLAAWGAQAAHYNVETGACDQDCVAYRQALNAGSSYIGCAQGTNCVVCQYVGVAPDTGAVYVARTGKACVSLKPNVGDAWCEATNGCENEHYMGVYCGWDEPTAPTPAPSAAPTAPTPTGTAPTATTAAPTPAPAPTGGRDCATHKKKCMEVCNAKEGTLFGGVKTNQCWGTPTYVSCECKDGTTLKLPEAPDCLHAECPCYMK